MKPRRCSVAHALVRAASTLVSTPGGAGWNPAHRLSTGAAGRCPAACGAANPGCRRLSGGAQVLTLLFLISLPAFSAVTGTVINRTTGLPQAGATVALNKLGQNGIELIDQAKSDAQGKFSINQTPQGTPYVIRTAFDGITYNHMLPPGSPTTDLSIEVFNVTRQPGAAKVSKHMLLFEPSGGQMTVNETYLFNNDGKTAWYDASNGTLHFFMPASAGGKATVQGTAPGGMPIGAAVGPSATPNVFKVDFPVKPGETRFDIVYTVPYTEGADYEGKVVTKDENTYLIAPNGVTLDGAGLNDLGEEPRSQAHIYGLAASAYKIKLTGAPVAATTADSGAADQPDNGPQIEQIMPRLYSKAVPIILLALGVLAVGFALLYRSKTAAGQETNERGRG
jgi:hypothetical protein